MIRLNFKLLFIICLLLLNTPVVFAQPSVLVNQTKQQVFVDGMLNLEVQEKINQRLASFNLAPQEKVQILTNNTSVISLFIPSKKGEIIEKQALTFDVNTGKELVLNDFIYLNEAFYNKLGLTSKDIHAFAITKDAILLKTAPQQEQWRQVPFEEIISWIDVQKIIGCFNIYNLTIKANGQNLQAAPKDLLVVLLPSDKLAGYSWEIVTPQVFNLPVVELSRSYILNSPLAEDTGYELFIFAVKTAEPTEIQLKYSNSWNKDKQANFQLKINQ